MMAEENGMYFQASKKKETLLEIWKSFSFPGDE